MVSASAPSSNLSRAEAVDTSVRENSYVSQTLNQQDLDRNFSLSTAQIFKWMQAARMDLPWMQPGYRALGWLEPQMPRRLLVASQMLRLAGPGTLAEAIGQKVTTRCEVGAVGRTSIEFRYCVYFGERIASTGTTTMIVVSGLPGSLTPSPVPEAVRALAAHGGGQDRTFLADSLAALPMEPPPNAYATTCSVRYSDEDVNRHANHTTLARFFEDAKEAVAADMDAPGLLRVVAAQHPEAILISYHAELRAGDVVRISIAASADGASALDIWAHKLPALGATASATALLAGRGRLICGGGFPPDAELLRCSFAPDREAAGSRL